MPYDRLGVLDAAFADLERPAQPMHVGFLAIAEGRPFLDAARRFRLDEVRQALAARLGQLPRLRQRLVRVPFNQGRPVWVDHDRFDIVHHVHLAALPAPGSEAQLKELMAHLQAAPLDPGQPLWELWFVEGLEGDRVGIIQKTHHALADGVAGVGIAKAMFDRTGMPVDIPPSAPAPGAPSAVKLLTATWAEEAGRPLDWARALMAAGRAPRQTAQAAGHLVRAAQAWTSVAPPTPLNVGVGPGRRFELVRAHHTHLRAIKRAHAATVNDVVLATVAGGLRHFLAARGQPVEGLCVKAIVPVSVRTRPQRRSFGNRLSALVVNLPVGEADPGARLQAVRADMLRHKEARGWVGAELALAAAEHLPASLVARLARLFAQQRAANLLVASVPGPRAPLHCLGARVDEVFPYAGPIAGMALMVSSLRYAGGVFFGLCADRDVVPDLAVLAEGIDKDLAALAQPSALR